MNVIWFVLDTLRSDHLSCYGYFRNTSPVIDSLAEEGLLFEDSYASAIATGPGFTSLFTGKAAINHGFYLTPWNEPNKPLLDDRILTLPEIIQRNGPYTTAAFDNLINFRSHMKQFVRGFEYYVNVTRSPGWVHHEIIGEDVNRRLIPWLENHSGEHFFALVHYWDPHMPYNMPEGFRGRFQCGTGDLPVKKAPDGYEYVPGWGLADRLPENPPLSIHLYDDEVYYTDYCVGQVIDKLKALGILDTTAVIVTSDHGEDLDLHGLWGHGTVHNTTIAVPLIVRDPSLGMRRRRVRGFVQHADNLPTIRQYFPCSSDAADRNADRAELIPPLPDSFDGQSVIDLALGNRSAPEEIIVESGEHRALLSPPWKLIWHKSGESCELFHLENDPLELNDRSSSEKGKTGELLSKLKAWRAAMLAGERSDPIYSVDGAWTCYIGAKAER